MAFHVEFGLLESSLIIKSGACLVDVEPALVIADGALMGLSSTCDIWGKFQVIDLDPRLNRLFRVVR